MENTLIGIIIYLVGIPLSYYSLKLLHRKIYPRNKDYDWAWKFMKKGDAKTLSIFSFISFFIIWLFTTLDLIHIVLKNEETL